MVLAAAVERHERDLDVGVRAAIVRLNLGLRDAAQGRQAEVAVGVARRREATREVVLGGERAHGYGVGAPVYLDDAGRVQPRQGLEEEGYAVEVAHDGESALDLIASGPPSDLIVLDLMLPRLDGFAVLKTARNRAVPTPVLVVTARDGVADKVKGLDLGADDYLTKPFSFDEFLARVRALLRRSGSRREPVLRLADLSLDPATREVSRAGRRITLTAREYALLEYFLRSCDRVLTRPVLAEHVWGLDFDPESNIIDVYVGYLRRKIDGAGERRLLHTVRGVGYVLKADDC